MSLGGRCLVGYLGSAGEASVSRGQLFERVHLFHDREYRTLVSRLHTTSVEENFEVGEHMSLDSRLPFEYMFMFFLQRLPLAGFVETPGRVRKN